MDSVNSKLLDTVTEIVARTEQATGKRLAPDKAVVDFVTEALVERAELVKFIKTDLQELSAYTGNAEHAGLKVVKADEVLELLNIYKKMFNILHAAGFVIEADSDIVAMFETHCKASKADDWSVT